MANPKKRRKWIIFTVIAVVVVGLALLAVFRKKDPIVTVQTEKVSLHNLTEIVVANGKIQPVKQVVISPEVAGEIVALPIEEGQQVKKGDLLLQIKPDNYIASRNSADANYKSAIAARNLAKAQLDKAETEYKRNEDLFRNKLVSDSVFLEFKTSYEVAKLQFENASHQEDQAKFGLDKADDDLSKTKIVSPMDGTVTRLQSQLGERVLGTSFNKGTEIMTIADLNEMEARVDIGEMDVVLIGVGQNARLEVDAFKNRKFSGAVSDIANSAKGLNSSSSLGVSSSSSSGQDATKFEVNIRITEKERFRPGMSVTAEIETRSRTNVLCVPIASVTTRLPKDKKSGSSRVLEVEAKTNGTSNASDSNNTNGVTGHKNTKETVKPVEVVFITDGDHVKMVPVKIGISDDSYWEITEGLQGGEEVVSGGYRAISKDLDDGKKISKGAPGKSEKKDDKPGSQS
jgi:HlyD family secretion protein